MAIPATVWAYDPGKNPTGETVRSGNEFLHKAPLGFRGSRRRRIEGWTVYDLPAVLKLAQ